MTYKSLTASTLFSYFSVTVIENTDLNSVSSKKKKHRLTDCQSDSSILYLLSADNEK